MVGRIMVQEDCCGGQITGAEHRDLAETRMRRAVMDVRRDRLGAVLKVRCIQQLIRVR